MVSFVTCMLAGVSILVPNVNAHQVVLLPKPDWKTQDKDTQYNPLAFLENQDFKTEESFAKYRDANGYKSLRDFFDNAKYTVAEGADPKCGFTDPNGPPQPIPAKGEMRSTGYTHDGPCEVWLDDKMVLSADNCHEKYPGKDYTVDYSSCKDSCTLYWFWLGVRNLKNKWSWQVYKACIPLKAGDSTAENTTAGNTTKAEE